MITSTKNQQIRTVIELKKKAKARRIEEKTVFLLKDGEKIAIHKRPASGLLAGLYEFPNTKGKLTQEEALRFVEGLSLSFGHQPPLFQNVNMRVRKGERIFLLGPNGCGKTSLLKTLLGTYQAQDGRTRFGVGIDLGYYDQIQAGLDSEKTVIDEIWDQ